MTTRTAVQRQGPRHLLRLIVTPVPPSRVRTGYHRPRATAEPVTGDSWRHRGACLSSEDPDAFFDCHKTEIPDVKQICGYCPVRADCLATALARNERWGIWGGLTVKERDRLRRRS